MMFRSFWVGVILWGAAATVSAAPVRFVEAEPLRTKTVTPISVKPGDASGTLYVDFEASYSNRCVANAEKLTPRPVVHVTSSAHGEPLHRIWFVVESRPRSGDIICPFVYRPVTLRYRTVVTGLLSEGDYRVVFPSHSPESDREEIFEGSLSR